MPIFRKVAKEVSNSVAFRIVELEQSRSLFIEHKRTYIDHVVLKSGDVLGTLVESARGNFWNTYKLGSVVSYALENGDDPIYGVDRARSLGHPLHWLNEQASVLSATPQPQEFVIAAHNGMVVCFEGVLFTVNVLHKGRAALLKPYTSPAEPKIQTLGEMEAEDPLVFSNQRNQPLK